MTKSSRRYLIDKLSIAIFGLACNPDYGNSIRSFNKGRISSQQLDRALNKVCTVSGRLGRDEHPVKRFTPPLPVEYWREKNTLENNVRSYITNGVYHRSHVERFAGTHPA